MTLIIAHRGSSGYKPEMTIPAYELALKQNVDGFETDVRLTKDLELVGIHDRKTGRVSNSDLVVVITVGKGFTYFQLADVQYQAENKLGIKVDIGFKRSLDKTVSKHAEKDMKLIYERTK